MEHTHELEALLKRHGFRRHLLTQNQAGHFQIVGQLNGENIDLLIDTGASKTVIDLAYCQSRQLRLRESGKVGGGAGGATLPISILEEAVLILEGAALKSGEIVAIDLSHVNRALTMRGATSIHAVLGADILLQQQAILEYATKSMYLKPEG